MTAVAEPLARLRARAGTRPFVVGDARAAVAVVLLVVTSLVLRTTALHARFWIDEGLSVGIASHPLLDIPGLLRQDGSPPLYYMLLHAWIAAFGDGEADTHALSVLFAV
ncbi:MAG TPA: hypothetical protein VLB47_13465, partial [Solirubrobacteraceae bacterium]|nr:hypothetical protein [Solirubrobacteraceae bacterium]